MERIAELWRRVVFYVRRRRFDHDLEEEMRAHLDMKTEEKIADGMEPDEARLAARREFGNVLGLRERSESVWAFASLDALAQDVRFAFRSMRRSPIFTFAAVLTLALGIGVNTAAFSVVRAVLIAPLPYPDAESLVAVSSENSASGDGSFGVSAADLLDLRRDQTSFSALCIYAPGTMTVDDGERLEAVPSARVSDGFFEALGVAPLMGRVFAAEEFQPGVSSVVISYDFWQQRFGGDPDVIGKTVPTARGQATVVGVMPRSFRLPWTAQMWGPMNLKSNEMEVHSDRYFYALGRLAPGVERARGEAELRAGADRLAESFPVSNANWSVRLKSLRETLVGDTRPAIVVLFVATLLVLLIACANVAHLLLARATARLGEITIRSALGASRGRLVRQLVTENLVLSLAGGALGALGALATIDHAIALVPPDLRVVRLENAGVDFAVFGFALLVSLATAAIFGVALAFKGFGADASLVMRGGRSATSGRRLLMLRGVLVSAEVALTIVLAVGAGLLIKSMVNLGRVDIGIDSQNLAVVRISAPSLGPDQDAERVALYGRIAEAVRNVPGVATVSSSASVPLGFTLVFPYRIEGETQFGDSPDATYSPVSPGYFRELKIPLLAGREFAETDRMGGAKVAVINDAMRRRHFAGADPIGRQLTLNYKGEEVTFDVVGVCGDLKQWDIAEQPIPEVFVSDLQFPWFNTALMVRTKGDPASVIPAVQSAIRSVDRLQAGTGATTLDRMVADGTARSRFLTILLGSFAALALLLAAIGIFGVMSYTVAQRTREIGIRMALGAQRATVVRMIVVRAMLLVAAGVVPGLVCAYALARLMGALLFGVEALDPIVLATTPAVLAFVALLACLLPARSAAAVDPITALRQE